MEDKDIIKTLKNTQYRVDGIVCRGFYLDPDFFKELIAHLEYQEAEIERLQTEKDNLIKTYAECQKAFLKEYIDELKAELLERGFYPVFIRSAIDKVGKKMVGEG